MRKITNLLIWTLTVIMTLSGCQTAEGTDVVPVPRVPTPTVMPTIAAPTVTPVVTQDPTPTPTLEPTLAFPPDMDCGEVFCQQPWAGLLVRPFGPDSKQTIDLAYPYASTNNNTLDPHHGVEFPNGYGTPVLAAQSGEVVFAGSDNLTLLGPYTGFYGNVVILRHAALFEGRDVFTLYAHLSEVLVETGQTLSQGDPVGKVGASGAAVGSHLHFEVRLGENTYANTTNPLLWFAPIGESSLGVGSTLAGLILDRYGQPLDRFTLSLEKLGRDGTVEAIYYPVTYYPAGVNGYPALNENFVLADLPPGDYRLAFIYGSFQEIFFTLQPGSLGFINLQLD